MANTDDRTAKETEAELQKIIQETADQAGAAAEVRFGTIDQQGRVHMQKGPAFLLNTGVFNVNRATGGPKAVTQGHIMSDESKVDDASSRKSEEFIHRLQSGEVSILTEFDTKAAATRSMVQTDNIYNELKQLYQDYAP